MIEIRYTMEVFAWYDNRAGIEDYARRGCGEKLEACKKYLADNPEMKTSTLRNLGVTVTTQPVGVNGWWSATAWCHGNKHECQHHLADGAVKGLLDMKVPV